MYMGEFWAAVAGAVVGGVIAFGLQVINLRAAANQRREEAAARRNALGHSLMFKMLQIHSNLHVLNRHLEESFARAKGEPWQVVLPLANYPAKVHFSPDEMAMLLSLGDDDVFNRVLSLDQIHNARIDGFEAYGASRSAITSVMSAEMKGMVGTSDLTDAEMRFLRPKMVVANDIIEQLTALCRRDVKEAWEVASELNALLRSKVGLKFTFTRADDKLRGVKPERL